MIEGSTVALLLSICVCSPSAPSLGRYNLNLVEVHAHSLATVGQTARHSPVVAHNDALAPVIILIFLGLACLWLTFDAIRKKRSESQGTRKGLNEIRDGSINGGL
jgi:hypothetical protein